jgi:hypothetical protein
MRFTSRRTLVTVAAAAGAITLIAGGATALAGSGSSSSSAGPPDSAVRIALPGPVAFAGPSGSDEECGPVVRKPGIDGPDVVATYLGLTPMELKQRLAAGKSLAEIATAQGKSVEGLKQAILDGAKADLDQAVADGAISAEEAATMLSKLREGIDDVVNGKGEVGVRVEVKRAGADLFRSTAADYLGLSTDQLTEELQAGKSLAEIASAHGKSVSGLKQKLVDAATAEIEKAVDKLVNEKGLDAPCGDKVAAFPAPGP